MVTALIFAGGTGRRMNVRSKPKQFLELHGKPIIIYTLEHFEYHDEVDKIVIVCLADWIAELKGLLRRYGITKVAEIVPGGETGHDSIYQGLAAMRKFCNDEDIVLIHDGVRPLITEELITENISAVREYGNAITGERARESVVRCIDGKTRCMSQRLRSRSDMGKSFSCMKWRGRMESRRLIHRISAAFIMHLCISL